MSETISTMLAQPITLASSVNITVTDSFSVGGRTVTLPAASYRMLLASASSGTGTEASPYETLSKLQSLVNAAPGTTLWQFTLTATGFVNATYTSTGTGTLAFDGGGIVQNMIGSSSSSFGLSAGTLTMTYHPSHVVYAMCRANDSGWVDVPQMSAVSELPDGSVVVFTDSSCRQRRTFDLRFHPKDWSTRSMLGSALTPLYPATSRWKSPTAAPGTAVPWSVKDFMRTAGGKRCAAALGNFQALIATTDTHYWACYLTQDTIQGDKAVRPSNPVLDQRYDWTGVGLWMSADEVVT